MEQLDTAQPETTNSEPTAAELAPPQIPEIWVSTPTDADERRFGAWINAAQRPRDVVNDIHSVLKRAPPGHANQWRIFELRGFGGWQPTEHDGLPTVLEVARGVYHHGPAYGALAARLGADSAALQPDKYAQSFVGDWPSLQAFAERLAEESGWHEQLARLPSSMRRYVRIDLPRLMHDTVRELTVIEHEGGIWVYDPRRW